MTAAHRSIATLPVGGTLSQWLLGRLSDHLDRRPVIVACRAGGVATGLVIGPMPFESVAPQLAMAALHSEPMLPIYALCLAHANDFAPSEAPVQTSGGLLPVYGVGAVAGLSWSRRSWSTMAPASSSSCPASAPMRQIAAIETGTSG